MLGETNTKEFFIPPKSLQKSDVNRHVKNSEDNKTTLLGCKDSSIMEELIEQFTDNFKLLASKEKGLKMQCIAQGRDLEKWCNFNCFE